MRERYSPCSRPTRNTQDVTSGQRGESKAQDPAPRIRRRWIPLTGELVLRKLDEHSGRTFQELLDALGLDFGPGHMALIFTLCELADSGLVAIDGMSSDETYAAVRPYLSRYMFDHPATWRTTTHWMSVTKALGDVRLGSRRPETAEPSLCFPVFGRPGDHLAQTDVFVLMPFSTDLRSVYEKCLVPSVEALRLTVARADDFYTSSALMTDIWSAIHASSLVIADCTGRNPNVFYELGIAHTVGVPTMMISQAEGDIPSDLRHLRYYVYHQSPPGFVQLGETVRRVLRSTVLES